MNSPLPAPSSFGSTPTIPIALTIAGSDSGGGAGIQADLRTFAFHRVHGTSALTCITAQNTLGVARVDALPPEAVLAQIEAVCDDIGVHAAKTGMLLNLEIIEAVAQHLTQQPIANLVVDPVMVSRAGAVLISPEAIVALQTQLLPQALLTTPNRYEAQLLTGLEIITLEDMKLAARKILDLGPRSVLVKGGGMGGTLKGIDVFADGTAPEEISLMVLGTSSVDTPHTHGTGCTLSAAIAANLALGQPLQAAVPAAKQYVTHALEHALAIGAGQGPVGHFYPLLQG